MYSMYNFPLNNGLHPLKAKGETTEMGLYLSYFLLNTMTAFCKDTINHEKSLFQSLTLFSLNFDY